MAAHPAGVRVTGDEPPDWALPSWDAIDPLPRRRPSGPAPSPGGATAAARHLRAPGARRVRRHQGRPGGAARRPEARRRLGRGRGGPGHDQLRRPRLLHPEGRAEPARLRLVPRRPPGQPLRGPCGSPGRGPRPDRRLRRPGGVPVLRGRGPAGRARRPCHPFRGDQGQARRRGAIRCSPEAPAAPTPGHGRAS